MFSLSVSITQYVLVVSVVLYTVSLDLSITCTSVMFIMRIIIGIMCIINVIMSVL